MLDLIINSPWNDAAVLTLVAAVLWITSSRRNRRSRMLAKQTMDERLARFGPEQKPRKQLREDPWGEAR